MFITFSKVQRLVLIKVIWSFFKLKSLCTACVPLPPKLLNVTCQLYLETVTDSTGDNKCLMLKFFILFCSVFLQEPLKFNPMWEKQSTKLMYDAIYSERLFRSNQGVVCFLMFCQKGETYQPNYFKRNSLTLLGHLFTSLLRDRMRKSLLLSVWA